MTRISSIRKLLSEQGLDGLFVTSESNIFYLTGITHFVSGERDAYVLLTKKNIYVFTDPRYSEALKDHKGINLQEVATKSHTFSSVQAITKKEKINHIGFEENSILFHEFRSLQKEVKVKLIPTVYTIEEQRQQKNEIELEHIMKACVLTDNAFNHILAFIKEGITEKELAFEIEFFIKKNGGELAFPTIVAFGKNAAIPHHATGYEKLVKNTFVLFDMGAKVNGYASDMSRTIIFGKADSNMRKVYDTVRKSQVAAVRQANGKHVTLAKIHETCEKIITHDGFNPIPHALGHGVGIEVHELPVIAKRNQNTLLKNSVFTIEPGIYIPGFGGVRIEDTLFYDGKSSRTLTHSPKDLIEL